MTPGQEIKHQAHCPMYQCGELVEVSKGQKLEDIICPHCRCPWWPLELGFTGNDPEDVLRFAASHDRLGYPLKKI